MVLVKFIIIGKLDAYHPLAKFFRGKRARVDSRKMIRRKSGYCGGEFFLEEDIVYTRDGVKTVLKKGKWIPLAYVKVREVKQGG